MGSNPAEEPGARPPSYGNLSDQHWSRARKDQNVEALEYYRERSKAPGVAGGGAERNFYCMKCDGVIPFEFAGPRCPHCAEPLDEHVKRYFNWVEINEPPASDAKALLRLGLVVLLVLALGVAAVWLFVR